MGRLTGFLLQGRKKFDMFEDRQEDQCGWGEVQERGNEVRGYSLGPDYVGQGEGHDKCDQ